MTFLNSYVLAALAAVAVPIVIHLLNRRSAKVVDWGAMHFLLGSLVSRKRRVLLDEILLLGCRCLLVALVVTALARPLIPAGSSIAWAVVLPVLMVGAVAFGVGTAVWRQRRARWTCYAVGAGLLTLALAAIALENVLHLGTLLGPSRDLVLVIDGSTSMTMEVEGRANFARAVDEARDLIHALKGSATVSIVLAGPVPEVKTAVPLTDTSQLLAVLDELKPSGGEMAVHEALRTASLILSTAANATKQIVLLTDGQKAGWEVNNRDLWQATAQETRTVQGSAPQVYVRVLDVPGKLHNLAVTELAALRRIVGTDRPLPIRTRLTNCGQTPVAACAAYLSVDGKQVDRRPVGQLDPGASETLTFLCQLNAPGPHLIEVKADVLDDLPEDNHRTIAIHVLDRLPVLVVNGRHADRPLERASALVRLALDPESLERKGKKPDADSRALVQPTAMELWQLHEIHDWNKYRLVILADVADLPGPVAVRLAQYVVRGGGLLIAPGEQASAKFYNDWTATVGEEPQPLLPATLRSRVKLSDDKEAVHPVSATLTHPDLQSIREGRHADLDTARLTAYWQLDARPGRAVLTAGRLSNGSPWLVEHTVGQGRVLLVASTLDLRDGDLPTRKAFLPLVHGLVYHLADDGQWELNPSPGREAVLRFPADVAVAPAPEKEAADPRAPKPPPAQPPPVEVLDPDGAPIDAAGRLDRGALTVQIDHLSAPGVYRLKLPESPEAAAAGKEYQGIPFTVPADAEESILQWLTDADLAKIRPLLDFQSLGGREDLQAIAAGRTHGVELWKSLMLMALLTVVGEVGLVWWISLQRIPETSQAIDFSGPTGTAEFRAELEKLRAADERDEEEPVIDLLEAEG